MIGTDYPRYLIEYGLLVIPKSLLASLGLVKDRLSASRGLDGD